MKTPRELLLSRHGPAEPRLDAVRRAALAVVPDHRFPSWPVRVLNLGLAGPRTLWRELILPSQRLWTALATAWILIFVINLSQRDPVSSVTGQRVRSPSVVMSWQVQQRLMNELLADRVLPMEADRPRNTAPKPRTQIIEMNAT